MITRLLTIRPWLFLFPQLVMLMSCEKSFLNKYANELSPAFEISFQSISSENQIDTITASSSKDEKDVGETASFSRSGDAITLSLEGHTINSQEIKKLQTTIVFIGVTDPYEIAGIYKFPADNKRVAISMSSYDGHGWQTQTNPKDGQLQITYDLLTLTWNGKVSGIKFPPVTTDSKSGEWQAAFTYLRLSK